MNTVNIFVNMLILLVDIKIHNYVDLHNVSIEYYTVYHSSGYCQPQDGQEDNESYSSSSKREEQS